MAAKRNNLTLEEEFKIVLAYREGLSMNVTITCRALAHQFKIGKTKAANLIKHHDEIT